MSRQIGSLNRSLFYLSVLQRQNSLISISDLTSSTLTSFSSNSTQTVFHIISNSYKSDIDTPDEILDSEPKPTYFSQPPFQPITPPLPDVPYPSPFSDTDNTPIFSPQVMNPMHQALSQWINLSMI